MSRSNSKRRFDVRGELMRLGWVGDGSGWLLRRGEATWFATEAGDSSVGRDGYTVELPSDVPAHVVIATCEAVAKGERRRAMREAKP